jgi:uncharacterized membrane protein
MQAKAKLLGHAVHPMLIPYPLALLTTAIIFDVIRLFTGTSLWSTIAFWMIAAGIIGGLIAALFGLIDWLGIPKNTRARQIGVLHGVGNVVMVVLFAGAWLLRRVDPGNPTTLALILELAGGALSFGTAWLGGELIVRHGMAVDDGANLNAPSSLSGRPASEVAPRATR